MALSPKSAAPAPARRTHPRVLAKNRSASAAAQRIHAPPTPTVTAADDKAAHEDQQTSRVEMLMLKGVVRPDVIGTMLGLGTRQVQKLQARVHARWEITGGGRTIARFRGEALSRLDLIESEAWSRYSNLEDPKEGAKLLKLLLDIQSQRNALLGLSQKVAERIGLLPDQSEEVLARIAAQRGLAHMAARLAEILAERRAAPVGETPDAETAE